MAFHLQLFWLQTLVVIDSESCQRLFLEIVSKRLCAAVWFKSSKAMLLAQYWGCLDP